MVFMRVVKDTVKLLRIGTVLCIRPSEGKDLEFAVTQGILSGAGCFPAVHIKLKKK